MRFSKEIKDSPTLKLSKIARDKINKGEDVISLAIGQPDFKTPKFVIDGVNEALELGFTGYSDSKGLVELRREIAKDFKNRYNANYNEEEVLVLPGAKMAIFLSLAALLEEDDEVIIISPFYVSYEPMIKIAEVSSKIIDIPLNEDFTLPINKIKASINSKTKVLILNYPNNPTGMLLNRKEMDMIASIIKENNIYLISDKIKRFIDDLIFEHRKNTFYDLLEKGIISSKNTYELPIEINPLGATSFISKSLYESEAGDLNTTEHAVITQIASLDNVLW